VIHLSFAKAISQAEIHYESVNVYGMNSMTFQGVVTGAEYENGCMSVMDSSWLASQKHQTW
jgi:hypothetical protein